MKRTINTKGFTLVELIIVITILVILATIAFVSFQGYAADTRDTKRRTELGNIRNSAEVKMSEGISAVSLVNSTGSNLATLSLAGTGVSTTSGTDYKAGDINFDVVGGDSTKYTDTYKIGASTKAGGVFQLAATLEKDAASAYVVGNYKKRSASGATINSTVGFYRVGDYVIGSGLTLTGQITSISTDKARITILSGSTSFVSSGANILQLAVNENNGLIAASSGSGTEVTNGSITALPYTR